MYQSVALCILLVYCSPVTMVTMTKYGTTEALVENLNERQLGLKMKTGDEKKIQEYRRKLLRQEAAVGKQNETESMSHKKLNYTTDKRFSLPVTTSESESPHHVINKRSATDVRQKRRQIVHISAYSELRNISYLLEPLIKEIIKAEHNYSLFNSSKFDEMRSVLDTYMKTLTTKNPVEKTLSTTQKPRLTTTNPWLHLSTDSNGYIVLGGGEDDEGDDDSDTGVSESSGDQSGSGANDRGINTDKKIGATQSTSTRKTINKTFEEEMGFVVFVDNSANDKQLTTKTTNRKRTTRTLVTKKGEKPVLPTKETDRTCLNIDYYGPCLFCKQKDTARAKKKKRKRFRQHLIKYDFVILAQKHPSGTYSAVLSLKSKSIFFPTYNYVKIHVPLTCGCFSSAPNTRYILAGKKIQGRLILNNHIPLYEVNDYKEVQQIYNAMGIYK